MYVLDINYLSSVLLLQTRSLGCLDLVKSIIQLHDFVVMAFTQLHLRIPQTIDL